MQPVEFAGYTPVGKPPVPRGNPGLVRMAVDELLNSKQPIMIAGGGTVMSGAFHEIREFAETLDFLSSQRFPAVVPFLTTIRLQWGAGNASKQGFEGPFGPG